MYVLISHVNSSRVITDKRARVNFECLNFSIAKTIEPDDAVSQGVDITIPVTCSVFEVDPMTSQCTRGVPRLKFRHKIYERWVIISFVAIASQ